MNQVAVAVVFSDQLVLIDGSNWMGGCDMTYTSTDARNWLLLLGLVKWCFVVAVSCSFSRGIESDSPFIRPTHRPMSIYSDAVGLWTDAADIYWWLYHYNWVKQQGMHHVKQSKKPPFHLFIVDAIRFGWCEITYGLTTIYCHCGKRVKRQED